MNLCFISIAMSRFLEEVKVKSSDRLHVFSFGVCRGQMMCKMG